MVLIFTITDEHQLKLKERVYRHLSWEEIVSNLEALWDWINHPLSNLLKLKHMSPNEANKILYTDIDIADYPSKISKDELLHILSLQSNGYENNEIDYMWLSLACGEIPITNGQYRQMTS